MNGRMGVYPAESGNPVIGRVLSPDIFVQAPGYTQSYNRYSYCMNNPLRYTDPSGWYVAAGSNSFGRFVYGPNINLCNTGNYENVVGGGGGGGAGGFGYGTAAYSGGGSSGSFFQQLAQAANNILNSNLPDGVYNLTSINNNNGTYEFSYNYNFRATININAAEAYRNRDAQIRYDNSLIAGPGGKPSTGKTRLEAMNEALAAFGIATSGVESFTGANASSRIVYYTMDGTKAWISTEKVLGLLRSAGIYAIGLGTAVDVTLSLSGEQSWGKTGLNTAIGVIAFSIGTGPGIVLGVGYLVLDKMGAFDIPKNIPSYTPP